MQAGKVSSFQVWVKPVCHDKVNKLIQQGLKKDAREKVKGQNLLREADFYNFSWQYPIYTSCFFLLTEGSLGITGALCCKINASVKLLSRITPMECNDSVSKMLTTAELRSFQGSTTKKLHDTAFRGVDGSTSNSYLFHTSLLIAITKEFKYNSFWKKSLLPY